jgi:signal transduction histidine kinase
MPFPSLRPSQPLQRRWLSPTSLQLRIILEVVALSTLGIGGIAAWAGWQMEQNLIAAHKQTLEYIATRFPEQLELYSEMGALEMGLARTVERVSTPELRVWVHDPNGKLLAQSPELTTDASAIAEVAALAEVPPKPMIVRLGNRDIVLCGSPLLHKGKELGQLYLFQDITMDQQNLNASLWKLLGVSGVTIALLIGAITHRIHNAMRPIEQMSVVASAISADDLAAAKLPLNNAPDEVLGLAQSFNEMLLRLSAAWEQQRQFVGNVSHELRTPLTVIAGYLQSLQRRGENLSTYQQQALTTAAAEAERTIRMLEDLLNLARADSGNLHFRLTPVMLNTVVMEVAAMSEKVGNRAVQAMESTDDVVALADQDRLQQVLLNLVDNAMKYSAPSQPVKLSIEKTAHHAMIHIQDYGIGIALAHQPRIFERFYRVDEAMTRSRDGTGLGLAIAKSLIEGMEGRLSLRSKPQEGSIFTITLPLWRG